MTKIKIKIVTARQSLAPGRLPFFRVTCEGCGHDDIQEVVAWDPKLHGAAHSDAYLRAERMVFDHLTLDGRGGHICPVDLFDQGEMNERIEDFFAPIERES